MIVSFILWFYLLLCSIFYPNYRTQTDDKSTKFFDDSDGLLLSAAYGFSSGELSPQLLTSLPISCQSDSSLVGKDSEMVDNQQETVVDEIFDSVSTLSNFDMRKVKLKTRQFSRNSSFLQVPSVEDKETILALAKISSNAYIDVDDEIRDAFWYEVDPFLREDAFGWDKAAIRGYVYANPAKTLVIMAIKGTSTAIFDGSGHTVAADKFNDNLMFSCCCARVDFLWDTVCPCFQEEKYCDLQCLADYARRTRSFPFRKNITVTQSEGMKKETLEVTSIYPVYYYQAIKIFEQLKKDYPKAEIWLTGHSLGGSLVSLLAMTFPGTVAIAFSAPGERMFAERLGLVPKQTKENQKELKHLMEQLPIFHIYNTADPIPYGRCSGIWSLCYIAGYAMESKCHVGHVCEYDLGKDKPYDMNKHKLSFMIDTVLTADYPSPICKLQTDCFECEGWNYI